MVNIEVSDTLKFAGIVLLYTAYVTWWASGIDTRIGHMQETLEEHSTQSIATLLKIEEAIEHGREFN